MKRFRVGFSKVFNVEYFKVSESCMTSWIQINSLAPEGFDYGLRLLNFISRIILSIFCEIAIRWMPQHLTDL